MKILVCGGRDYVGESNKDYLFRFLDEVLKVYDITKVITGGAKGADSLAVEWATSRNIPVSIYQANWFRDGKAAGPIRNKVMLTEGQPDLVIAFPTGGPGTKNMIKQAEEAGVKVVIS